MGGLFGGGKAPQSQKQQPAGALNVQTSIYGSAYPLVYGKNRVPVNLIHYLSFRSIAHTTKQKTGGKGGGKAQSQTTYTYQVAMAASVGVGGSNTGIGTVWKNKEKHSLSSLGLTFFGGAAGQTAWSYLTGAAPSQAVPYANMAYIAAPAFQLGDSPSLPNLNVEFMGLCRYNPGTNDDALLSDIIVDYLTNPRHGAGFGAYLADLDVGAGSFRKYCLARGLYISPIENNQRNAGAFLKEMAELSNSAMVWRNGKLHFIPYGDTPLTGYTPDLTPLYDLTERDFLFEKGQPPVKHSTKNPSQQFNHLRMEFNNRANDYNPSIVEVKDAADIDDNGLRTKPVRKCTAVTLGPLARDIIQLEMQRDLFVVNTYAIRLGIRHSLIEPMDYLTITEPGLGLDRQLVRVIEAIEQDDAMDVTVEEVSVGVANAPIYNTVGPQGYNQDFNASPGNTQDPLIMNAPGLLTETGFEMWINACGVNFDLWGGCQVWISDDDLEYRYVGSIMGPARYGALAANLPIGSADYDTTSVARVQLYSGQFLSGTQEDVDDWRTLLFVGGEWIAYRDATLVSGTTYDLDTFRRAGYGSVRAAHSVGAAVAMIDEATFRLPYDKGNVGKQVYLKFPAFNVFGGALQDMSTVPAYAHTIGASEMTAPMNFADIGGNGVNILPDQYSTYEAATLPALVLPNGAVCTRDATNKIIAASLKVTGPANAGVYLGASLGNLILTPGKRYIVSCWLRADAANKSIRMFIERTGGVYTYTDALVVTAANTWQRVSGLLDLSANTTTSSWLGFLKDQTGDFWVDGLMVEEAVGLLNAPSTYARGQSSSMAVAAIAAAAAAQDTADGKIDSFFQTTAPASGMALGDLWFDTDDGNKQYRYNGSTWVVVQDTAIGTAIANAAGAQATADSKVRTFYAASTATPTATGVGDLWYVTDLGLLHRWSGSAWVKVGDVSASVSTDYCPNPAFAQGFEYWSAGTQWYHETSGGYLGTRHATAGGSAGTPDSRLSSDRIFTVVPGEAYALSGMFASIGANGSLNLGLLYLDGSGGSLGSGEVQLLGMTGTWARKKVVVIIPAGVTSARLTMARYNHTSGFYYAWDMKVTRLTSDAADNILGIGKNLIPNSEFGAINGTMAPWTNTWNPATGTFTVNNRRLGISGGASWTLDGAYGQMSIYRGARAGGSGPWVYDWSHNGAPSIPVQGGARYELHARLANHRCSTALTVGWYDASGTYINEAGTAYYGESSGTGGKDLNNWAHGGGFFVAPSNAVSARIWFRRTDTDVGQTDSYSWYTQPYFGRAGVNQTIFSTYSPGPAITADGISFGEESSVVNVADVVDNTGWRRIGLRVSSSGHRLGSQRNTVRVQTSSYGSVRTTTALSATSAGAVSVNAHTVRYGSFNVSYNAVSNAVTGLTVGTTYVIYCYDGDYSGGTKTYYAGTNPDAVMQLGDDIIIIGQILIPSSGSSSGGGSGGGSNPGDWCVDAESFLPDGTLAGEMPVGWMLPCYNNRPETPNIVHLPVQANRIGESECLRMVTTSGAVVVASVTTPMTLRNGACVMLPDMLHRDALVYRRDGTFKWEEVVALEPVGVRRVAKISVSDQCYFAGESTDAFIATHNIQQMKP